MFGRQVKIAGIAIVAALGLSACSDYGYGYGGVNMGYGASYYDDPYYAGGGFGNPYWGWYDNFYYPGTGYYVYDRYRRPHRWTDTHRRYWEGRRYAWRGAPGEVRNNWREFRRDRRMDNRDFRRDRRADRRAYRSGEVTRPEFRAERRQDRRDYRREYRRDYRQLRRENRQDSGFRNRGGGARSGIPRTRGDIRSVRNPAERPR